MSAAPPPSKNPLATPLVCPILTNQTLPPPSLETSTERRLADEALTFEGGADFPDAEASDGEVLAQRHLQQEHGHAAGGHRQQIGD